MSALQLTLGIGLAGLGTGLIGSLTGLGGGFVIVPLLTLVFGVDIRYAVGASLVCVIATSSGAAAAYVREGYTNVRIGMFLEIATTIGAIVGASLAPNMPGAAIAILFGLVMLHSSWSAARVKKEPESGGSPDRVFSWLRLDDSYPTPQGAVSYRVR
ncbi:MAG TPA: sulfite exporter TauE/SafE family protein, partial [Bryobacteraceae bacterium]